MKLKQFIFAGIFAFCTASIFAGEVYIFKNNSSYYNELKEEGTLNEVDFWTVDGGWLTEKAIEKLQAIPQSQLGNLKLIFEDGTIPTLREPQLYFGGDAEEQERKRLEYNEKMMKDKHFPAVMISRIREPSGEDIEFSIEVYKTIDKPVTVNGYYKFKNVDLEKQYDFDTPFVNEIAQAIANAVLNAAKQMDSNESSEQSAVNKAPVFLDSFIPGNYSGRALNTDRAGVGTLVAARDDYSFVVRDGTVIRDFGMACDFRKDISNIVIDPNDTEIYKWTINCYDGKNIVLFNKTKKASYTVDQKYTSKKTTYSMDDEVLMGLQFDVKGNPYIYSFQNKNYIRPGHDVIPEKKYDFIDIYNPYNFVFAGDEIYTTVYSSLTIYDTEGKYRDSAILDADQYTVHSIVKVFDDKSFLSHEYVDKKVCFVRYERNGKKRWVLPCEGELVQATFNDYKNGVYYFSGSGNGKIIRYAEEDAKLPAFMKTICTVNAKIEKLRSDHKNDSPAVVENLCAPLYLELAKAYIENGGNWLAVEALKKYLELSPADSAAVDKKLTLENKLIEDGLSEEIDTIFEIADEYGEYSAQEKFKEAAVKIEKLLKQNPNLPVLQNKYQELLEMFGENRKAGQEYSAEVEVGSVEIACLFPAMKNAYIFRPAGKVHLKNTSGKEITNVSVSCSIRKYMDYTSTAVPVEKLGNKKECDVNVFVALNDNVMSLNENTVVQMQFKVKWNIDGKSHSMNFTRPVTLYKKSAITWADTAMLGCFIQPNDPTVSAFVFDAMNSGSKLKFLSKNFANAVTISEAFGAYKLNYVPDPVTPLNAAIENHYAVDTVRFPAETFKVKGGDCDDMTAAYCSLLESAGIQTAFVTVEGHILCAFNTGIKYNSIWEKISKERIVFEHQGNVWIPMETTIMYKGFDAAWVRASEILNASEIEEFVPVSEAQVKYPAFSAEMDKVEVQVNKGKVAAMTSEDCRNFKEVCLEPLLASTSIASKDAKELNAIAQFYHNLGDDDSAIDALVKATTCDPGYKAAFSNLAAIYKQKGMTKEYQAIAKNLPAKQKNAGETTARAADASQEEWEE